MAKGTIQRIVSDKGFGFIRPDGGGAEVFFHRSTLQGAQFERLNEGAAVTFELERGPKGPRATVVRVEAAVSQSAPAPQRERRAHASPPQGAARSLGDAYRFLNPYNFIRYLGPPKSKPDNKQPETWQLWRCPPPPHDRYTGLSGRITCEVEAVTPLFISDSHAVEKSDKHPTYRFFEYEGQAALPPTSLRGIVRSVFEAATNSCFSVFDERRLSYRLAATRASSLVPARVEKRNGAWVLRLLPGFTPLDPGRRPNNLYAATINLYDPLKPSRPRGGGRPANPPKVRMHGIAALEHGERYYALVDKKGIFTIVDDIADSPGNLPRPARPSQSVVEGWVCFNNQNVDNKRKERFFFRDTANITGPPYIPLPDEVRIAYEDLIKDYQLRHEDRVKERKTKGQAFDAVIGKEEALSRYMYDRDDLKMHEGTLVYASLGGTSQNPTVKHLFVAPAAVPRVAYDHRTGDLLPQHLHTCEDVRKLCPACRVFGWVRHVEPGEELREDVTVAYAGRLRFSYGKLLNDAGTLPTTTLAILSSPKPTTTRFYLRPERGKPRDNLEDEQAGYDGPNILRGRKFYRHQGQADPQEYERATGRDPDGKVFDGKDDQNRTIRGARKPGTTFSFTIDFHNLAPVELGALLWALELQEDGQQGYHRLGFAKPLGFGSVKLRVTELETINPATRYTSVDSDGWQNALSRKEEWLKLFRETMTTLYEEDFAALENIRDLMALATDPPDLPVHYPRTTRRPTPEGKNFEWFMGNNRAGKDHGPRLALKLADEDTQGLPLLDRQGSEVR